MLVETYEVESVGSHPEVDDAALELINKLGLTGQQEINTTNDGGTAVMPYRVMTEEEEFCYSRLCPIRTSVERYKSGPIPLRVLQVLEHARTLPQFGYFEVWHPRDARRDPVLVAREAQYRGDQYILARWGEVLDEIPAMLRKAAAIAHSETVAKLTKNIREWEAKLALIQSTDPENCQHAIREIGYIG